MWAAITGAAWQERLAAWLPAMLFRPGWPAAAPRLCTLPEGQALDEALTALAPRAGERLRLMLPKSAALQRAVTLPRLSSRQAAAAIGLRLRQTLPHQGAGLVWQSEVVSRDGAQQRHMIYLVKAGDLAALRAAVQTAGAELTEIGIAAVNAPPLWPPSGPGEGRDAAVRRGLGLAMLGVLLVAAALIWRAETMAAQMAVQNEATQRRLALVEGTLLAVAGQAEQVQNAQAAQAADLARLANGRARLGLLADLTRDLPDSIWLSEIVIGPEEMRLSGFAKGEVGDLVTALQAAPWAQSVRLDGPVLLDPQSQQNRFNLWVALAAPAGGGTP